MIKRDELQGRKTNEVCLPHFVSHLVCIIYLAVLLSDGFLKGCSDPLQTSYILKILIQFSQDL